MQDDQRIFSVSDLKMNNRSSIDITGVEEVLSYDEHGITLLVCGEKLIIEGENLRVSELCTKDGRVSASGRIFSLFYEETRSRKKSGFLGSILRT